MASAPWALAVRLSRTLEHPSLLIYPNESLALEGLDRCVDLVERASELSGELIDGQAPMEPILLDHELEDARGGLVEPTCLRQETSVSGVQLTRRGGSVRRGGRS